MGTVFLLRNRVVITMLLVGPRRAGSWCRGRCTGCLSHLAHAAKLYDTSLRVGGEGLGLV